MNDCNLLSLFVTFYFTIMLATMYFPRSNLMHCLNIKSTILKLCYNDILTLHFWECVLQWSTIKTKYPNFKFFQHFYIPTIVNYVVKDDQKPVAVFNMVSRILKDMLEPYPHIVAFKRIACNGLPLYSLFRNEWFTMKKHVITMIMTMVNHVFVALWLHSWPWVWNKKRWPWNNHQ